MTILISALMADGTSLHESVTDFAGFVAVVLPLRRDPECQWVQWAVVYDTLEAAERAAAWENAR